MNYLGIYFGVKDINLVEVSGKRIVNNVRFPHPGAVLTELEEKVPVDIKIIALLKDAFRNNNISANTAFFSISGQDLIIRTFEIPLLPQSELKSAINFEAKKYIPFKLEELDFDFQVLFNKKNKTSLVLFMGIKKGILANYISIAKQLNLKVEIVEYAGFSILRFLKLAGLSDAGIMATLCYDLNNEDEANFEVFENGFSLFSRNFVLAGGAADFEQSLKADSAAIQEKLKNEIRVSLDYYKRKFPDKAIKNIFVVSDKEGRPELNTFFGEFSLPVKFVETDKVLGKAAVYSSLLAKSLSAALSKTALLKSRINLIESKLQAVKLTAGGRKIPAFLGGISLDIKFVVLGVVICAAVFGYGLMRVKPMQNELVEIKGKQIKIDSVVDKSNLEELSGLSLNYKKKIVVLDNLVKNQMYATYPLDVISSALPGGVWLEKISLTNMQGGAAKLVINGQVYLKNGDKELELVNIFLDNLKKNPVFSGYFKEILISSVNQKSVKDDNLTVFTISCQNIPEKK